MGVNHSGVLFQERPVMLFPVSRVPGNREMLSGPGYTPCGGWIAFRGAAGWGRAAVCVCCGAMRRTHNG